MISSIQCALQVITGDYFPIDENAFPVNSSNPEQALLEKEAFITLSEEAQEFIKLIETAPERIYRKDRATFNHAQLNLYLKRRKGWGYRKVEEIKFELWFFLRAMSFNGEWR